MSRQDELKTPSRIQGHRLPWWSQLRLLMAFAFMVVVLVPLGVLAYLSATQTREAVQRTKINQLESVSELKRQEIDRWLRNAQESLQSIAVGQTHQIQYMVLTLFETPEETVSYGAIADLLKTTEQEFSSLREIFFYAAEDGRILASSNDARFGETVRTKPYFEASKAAPFVQTPYYEITNELVMVVTLPVTSSSGRLIGVLAAELDLDELSNIMLERTGLGRTGETYLVSAANNFLLTASRFEGYEQTRAYRSEGIDAALSGDSGSGIYDDYRGTEVVGVYTWMPELQAGLFAEIDTNEAFADFQRRSNTIAIAAIVLTVIAAAVGIWFSRRLTTPILSLVDSARKFASGDLSQRVSVPERTEVGLLSRSFNDMADQLQTLVESLEDRVQDRTQDLFLTLEVGQLASRMYRLDELLPRVTAYIREQFDLYYAQVYLNDDANRYAVLMSGTGEVGEQLLERGHRLDLKARSIVARAVQSKRPVLVSNTLESEVFLPNPLLPDTRSEISIPLIVGDEVIGVLDMQANEIDTFREDNQPVFEAMASQLASAIRSAQAYSETEAAVERATAINRRLTTEAWESYLGNVGRKGRVGYQYNLQNVEEIDEALPLADVTEEQPGDRNARLARPLKIGAQVIGSIALSEDGEREWTPDEVELVDSVADRLAQALEQYRAFDETRRLLDETDRRALEMQTVAQVGAEASSSLDVDRLLWDVSNLVKDRFGLYHTHFYLVDGSSNILTLTAGAGDTGRMMVDAGHRIPMDHERSLVARAARSRETVVANDIMQAPNFLPNPLLPQTRSEMAVPLIVGDRLLGVMDVQANEVDYFNETSQQVQETLAAQISVAINNARLFVETNQRAVEMQTVAEVGAEASQTLDVEKLMWDVSELVKDRFGLYHAHIYLLDASGESLSLAAGAGDPGRMMVESGHRIAVAHPRSLVARAARDRKTVVVDNVVQAPDFLPNPLLPQTRSEMAIPMLVGDRLLGVLDVQSNQVSHFTPTIQQVQETLTAQISVAINNANLFVETDRRAVEMQTVAEVGAEASSTLDVEQLLWKISNLITERFGLYHAHVYLLDQETHSLRLAAGAGDTGRLMVDAGHNIAFDHARSLVARAARSRGTVKVDDVRLAEDFLPNPMLPRTRSEMAIPMVVGDRLLGVLDVQSDQASHFSPAIQQVQETLTAQISVAVNNANLFLETDRRAVEMQTVAEVGAEASSTLDVEQLLWKITDLVSERFGLYHAHVYLLDEDGHNLRLAAGAGDTGRMMVQSGHTISATHARSLVARAARSRETVVADDVRRAEDFLPNPMLPRTRSEMAIPMVVSDRLIGVLDVQSDKAAYFTPTIRQVQETLTAQISVAINNARLFVETDRRAVEMQTVAEVGAEASSTLDVEQLLWNISNLATERFNLYHAHVYLLDERTKRLQLAAGAGDAGRMMVQAGHNIAIDNERSLVARAARSRETVIVDDVRTAENFLPNPMLPRTRSEMAVPMVVGDRLIGVLDVQSDQAANFTAASRQVQETLASQVAVAVNNARLFDQVEQSLLMTELLYNASRLITEATDESELLAAAVESVALPGVNRALVVTLDRDGEGQAVAARVIANWHSGQGPLPSEIGRVYELETHPVFRMMSQPEPVFFPDLLNDERIDPSLHEVLEAQEIRAMAGLPLWVGGRYIGSIFLESSTPQKFSEGEIRPLTALTGQMAVALDSLQLLAQTQRRASEMETVAQVGAEASTSLEPDRLLQEVVDLTQSRFGLYHAHIYLLDRKNENLVLAAGAGDTGRMMAGRGHRIPLQRPGSLVARAARMREAVVENDVRHAPEFLPNPLLPRTRAEMAIPMIVGRNVIGVLDVQADAVNSFTAESVQVMGTLASQVAVAVNNARLFEEQVGIAERLIEVDRLKSEFLASMSHELRTPLNSIIGYAEVLLDGIDGDLTDDMEEDVGAIHGSGKHLLNLINDILDLAKIEAGQMDLVTEVLELRPLVEDMASTTRVLLKNKSVEILIDIPDNLPLINGDPLRLRQVISNLVTNASKFTETGSITVWAKPYEADTAMIEVGVTDTGIGMNDEQLAVIFDRFRQVDQSHTRRAGGTGLGLSITRQLIQMHGGDINVSSEVGTGSTFSFTLPVATEDVTV